MSLVAKSATGSGTLTSQTKPPTKYPKKKYRKKDEHLSEEDLALKRQLELYVEGIQNPDPELQKSALQRMRQEIRPSASSMTSVPKPLKFLRPHYGTLKAFYETVPDSDFKKDLADVLSVLALTMSAEGERESLKYRLLGSGGDIESWGHEYVRNLAGEIAQEYMKQREDVDFPFDDIMELVKQIVAILMKHNAETEAVDLLMEVEDLELLSHHVDSINFRRTCLYLTSAARYLAESDDMFALDIAYTTYLKFAEFANAFQIALFLGDSQLVTEVFTSCDDLLKKKQFCYILARHGFDFEVDDEMCWNDDDRILLQDIINNNKLSENYLTLARDMEVMEPKYLEDIYKAWAGASVDSGGRDLAATFVNAFVNAGFHQDKLMTVPTDSSSGGSSGNWVFRNKQHGKISAAASLGLILLWDVDFGLAQIDKYIHSNDNYVIAGALLGVGLVNCNVSSCLDPARGILREYISNEDSSIRIGAIMGLGIAYAGAQNEQICKRLTPILKDGKAPLDVIAFTAISLGLIYMGSSNEEVAQAIVDALIVRSESELGEPLTRLIALGHGLLYLGKQEEGLEAARDVSEMFDKKIRKYCDITVLSCAYAGTGNILKVQEFLGHCDEHLKKGGTHQGPAVLGIAMVAMAEELGLEMSIRSLEHLLQYGELNIRRAVPLALGLLCISNPKVNVMDILSRLSRDTNLQVVMAAIISLGLIGAGTNNARIVFMLRNLSSYYYRVPGLLFCVQIAQGLVHLGRGLLTLDPYHCDRFLLSPTSLAGLVITLHACLDMKTIILGKYHFVLYFLALAMRPRMLTTVNENLEPLSVPVRVGQAVDVVGKAGQPKTITGFQTYTTPVLLEAGKRAELATEKYIPLSPTLEGHVILIENPEYRGDN
ncbi:26S PROTEASOME REGULATORY SUBUNIT S2 1A, 26S proteasome regulatory subunit S2 1A [Hibiscus trionum]|uniref:26S proteasome non-ATPase regulatory subunit 2 homolog n=1 Tax=Hibiscus trionum TaxID=183268 RepID=A0A9W7MR98_HIBTR|nr:26S PROTEASOME REGULATORY SUBUNIT S2 1A, 26S proteasome regulatory subunit S2 1A [Hibiscus trionum]